MVDKIGAGQPNKISQYEIDQIAATLRREIDKMLGKGNPTDVAILDAVKKNPIFGTDKIPEADLHKLIAQARDDKVDDEAIKEAGKSGLDANGIMAKLLGPEYHVAKDEFTGTTKRYLADRIYRATVVGKPAPTHGAARFGSITPVDAGHLKKMDSGELLKTRGEVEAKVKELIGRKLTDMGIMEVLQTEIPNKMYYVSENDTQRMIVSARLKNVPAIDLKKSVADNLAMILGVDSTHKASMNKDFFPETRSALIGKIQERLNEPVRTVSPPDTFSVEVVKPDKPKPARFGGGIKKEKE